MTFVVVVFGFLVGIVIGSFLNVVVSRVPKGGAITHPPSHCPSCGTPVRWYDNVPVVSWLVLRGKCCDCGWRIPARYPLIELAGGIVGALIALAIV